MRKFMTLMSLIVSLCMFTMFAQSTSREINWKSLDRSSVPKTTQERRIIKNDATSSISLHEGEVSLRTS
jgi:hypothetical protein